MQTREEVTGMHAAITRTRALIVILAVATTFLGLGLAPIEDSQAMLPNCPAGC